MNTILKNVSVLGLSTLVFALSFQTVRAGELSRVRGEANALLRTAKVLNERICYLDANGNSAVIAAKLEATVYAVKDLIYADASIYEVDALIGDITVLNDALIRSLEYNYTLAKDRRVNREIELFQDRFVYLRKDLDRARKYIVKRQPVSIKNRAPVCVTGSVNNRPQYGNSGYYAPGRAIDPRFYDSPIDQFRTNLNPNARQNFGPSVRQIDNRGPVNPQFRQPQRGPQIRVSTPNADLKTELMRLVLSRIAN